MHALDAVLTPEAAHLVAAKRRHVADCAIGVDPDRAGADGRGDLDGALDRLRPDTGRKPERDVVGDLDGFLVGLEADDRQHRSEDLFLRDTHPVGYAGEDRRLHEEFAVAACRAAGRPAAQQALRAFRLRDLDVLQDLLVLRRGRDRADLRCRIHRVADAGLACEVDETRDEFIVDAVLHQQARAGDTGLPGRGEDT